MDPWRSEPQRLYSTLKRKRWIKFFLHLRGKLKRFILRSARISFSLTLGYFILQTLLHPFHWPRISFFLFPGRSSDGRQLLLCVWKHYPVWSDCPKNCLRKLGMFSLGSYWERPTSGHGALTSVWCEGIWGSSVFFQLGSGLLGGDAASKGSPV